MCVSYRFECVTFISLLQILTCLEHAIFYYTLIRASIFYQIMEYNIEQNETQIFIYSIKVKKNSRKTYLLNHCF